MGGLNAHRLAAASMAAPHTVRRKAWPGSIPPASPPCRRASCGPAMRDATRFAVLGFNLDTSIMKNFNISKEGQWKLQLRAETFNTLNWVNPSGFAFGEQYGDQLRSDQLVPRRAPHSTGRQDQLLAPSILKTPRPAPRQREPAFFIPGRNARIPANSTGVTFQLVAPPPMCCVSGQSALSGFITISVRIVSPLFFFGP
jgi:hypothetical protein